MSTAPVDYPEAVRAVAVREDDIEGIPVFLALEDEPAVPGPDRPPDALGRLALGYLEAQLAGREEPTLEDVALVLKVLGAEHFDLPDGTP